MAFLRLFLPSGIPGEMATNTATTRPASVSGIFCMKVGATTSALLLWRVEGGYEKFGPGAASQSLGKLGRTAEGWPASLAGGEGKIDDARFSRGKSEFAEIQIQASDLALTAR